ncbi:hypothetical protein EUGRSUZ_H04248, partial [Eucalyptus grandis]
RKAVIGSLHPIDERKAYLDVHSKDSFFCSLTVLANLSERKMADSAVSFLVEKLAILVEKEVKQLKGVRREIEFIKDEFEHMKAFLERAESPQEDDPQLKVWVKQVREVAYDTEDVLDEFMLNLAKDHGHGFMGYFRKIKSSIQNLKARHCISSDIADIKSRVNNIAERRRRYNFTGQSAISSTGGTSQHVLREDGFLGEEGELVGIDEPVENLIKWLLDEESGLEVVSILGMGGRVKTFFQSHVWIKVSQSYKIEDILRDMIVQLHREFRQMIPQGIEIMRSTSLKQIVKDILQQKRYVIILDDVWDKDALEGIKNAMPNSSLSSRIIITTRITDIATASSNQSKVYELKPLSPKESRSLLGKKAFFGNPCPSHLEEVSEWILKKCEGLPLAIVAIGGLLFGKDVQEWEMISCNLAAELESNDVMQNFRKILSLSYNDLHYNLKNCFMYLGVFPEDCVIKCATLIRLWIAEGFVKEREGMTLGEVAQRYLKELVNRSLVQIVETTLDGRIRSCRIHDLMRESILSKLRDINFISFASEQKVELHERVRHLSVQYTYNDVLKQLNLPSLHSLVIFESATLSSSYEQFVPSGCRLLRVLDLRDSPLHEFPQQILVMFHLKYLSLRRTKVHIIPRSIGKLQNLETLDLKQTLVSELPVEITKLKKLQCLLVYNRLDLGPSKPFCAITRFSAPRGIGALASLQKLYYLGELQLRRLGITDVTKDDAKELCHSLKKMTKLQSLDVTAEFEVIDLDFPSSPPLLLRSLYVEGCLKKLPDWLPLLNNLARLQLKSNKGFPKLKNLFLEDLENLRFVSMNGQAMPSLQRLIVDGCKHLDWQSLLVVIRSLTLLMYLRFDEMPEEFTLAFFPNSSSKAMRDGIMQECYEEICFLFSAFVG